MAWFPCPDCVRNVTYLSKAGYYKHGYSGIDIGHSLILLEQKTKIIFSNVQKSFIVIVN